MKKDLAQLIRENPGAYFEVDNDCWSMFPGPPPEDHDEWYRWRDSELVDDTEVLAKGDGGYGSGCTYGGDILQALAEIVGVTIESV